jgi:hypothetical protein
VIITSLSGTFRVLAVLVLAATVSACRGSEKPAPSAAARATHKAGIAAAAKDRMLLQYFVKEADAVNRRVPALRPVSKGYVIGDTSVIWFAFFAGDTLLVLDETRRVQGGGESDARYIFRDTLLRYIAFDRKQTPAAGKPVRTRLAFGFDSVGALSASSKNVNDAAIRLDTITDVTALVRQAQKLRALVLDSR